MTAHTPKPNVTIIDAKDLRRAGLAILLKAWAELHDLEVVAVAPAQVIGELSVESECRMLVLSVGSDSLATRETLQWLKALRALAPEASLVIVSDRDQPEEVSAALDVSAHGFIPTDLDPELALRAFSFVLVGGSYFPPSAIRRLSRQEAAPGGDSGTGQGTKDGESNAPSSAGRDSEEPRDWSNAPLYVLTAREREVLDLLRLGMANKLIARQLGMTEGTVKVHVRHIMRKFGATNRTQAALCGGSSSVAPEPAPIVIAPVVHQ